MLKISWDYFKRVRRLDVPNWLRNRDVKSYTDFVERLKELGVQAPSEEEYRAMVPPLPEKPVKVDDTLNPATTDSSLMSVFSQVEPLLGAEEVKVPRKRSRGNPE